MPNFLALSSMTFWLILMVWLYHNSPTWFFMPFFVAATLLYLKMMEVKSNH
jgi:hypothetical protein